MNRKKIIVEANKIVQPGWDGTKRYGTILLQGIHRELQKEDYGLDVDLLLGRMIVPLEKMAPYLHAEPLKFTEDHAAEFNTGIIMDTLGILDKIFPRDWYKIFGMNRRQAYYQAALIKMSMLRRLSPDHEFIKRLNGYDMLQVLLPQHAHFFSKTNMKLCVTLLDMTHEIYKEYHQKENIKNSENGIQHALDRDALFIAISNSTLNDFAKFYPSYQTGRGVAIHLALMDGYGEKITPNVRQKYGLGKGKFFVCLSTLEPRKNLVNTIRAFKLFAADYPEIKLAVCGKKGWKFKEIFKEDPGDNILFTGFVDDEDLPALYQEATALCYASHYEGFGFPLLEAMAMGTPVIYGDNSSMPEVVGDTGFGVDSNDIQGIRNRMEEILLHPDPGKLSIDAKEQASNFSIEKLARETLIAYQKELGIK